MTLCQKAILVLFALCALCVLRVDSLAQEIAQKPQNPTLLDPEKPDPKQADTYRYLNLFGEVFERTRENYVEEVTDKELVEAALNGMLSELDPHSSYLNADDFTEMSTQAIGEFGGLGIQVTMEKGLVKVVSPIDNTPAWRAGIQPGDFIVEIDKKPVMDMKLDEAVDKMRGAVGTPVELRIMRESTGESLILPLVRDVIPIHTVRSRLEGDIGYVRITSFNQKTTQDVQEAVNALKTKAKETKTPLIGYVLDMRSNPGGVLEGAVGVSDIFLDRGEIVSTRGRDIEGATRENASHGDLAEGLPMVVLINAGTASASEIVAGALQDHGRAVVLGTRSFGKGSVQTVMPLGPGAGAMRLTTARYYTPSGRSIQAKGIEPDIVAEPAKIETLESGFWREADLNGALQPPSEDKIQDNKTNTKEDEKEKTSAEKDKKSKSLEEQEIEAAKNDYQLIRALDLLHALSAYHGGPAMPEQKEDSHI